MARRLMFVMDMATRQLLAEFDCDVNGDPVEDVHGYALALYPVLVGELKGQGTAALIIKPIFHNIIFDELKMKVVSFMPMEERSQCAQLRQVAITEQKKSLSPVVSPTDREVVEANASKGNGGH